jgi:hypothetical protein
MILWPEYVNFTLHRGQSKRISAAFENEKRSASSSSFENENTRLQSRQRTPKYQ